jgi:hypothetical protein
MNTKGFYKKIDNTIQFGEDMIAGDGYLLLAEEKDSYEYPVGGWIWADSLDEAMTKFITMDYVAPVPFDVQPENYKLTTNREDETEFSKLINLLTLGLQQNRFLPTTEITIWDHIKMPRTIAVQRFLEIMVDYGLHCYSNRS